MRGVIRRRLDFSLQQKRPVQGFRVMLRECSRLALFALLAMTLSACKTHSITNLTPGRQARSDAGVYRFEVGWGSHQQSIRTNSIKPFVVIGSESYPMERTPVVRDRWEAFVPAPADAKEVHYRFKFDYEYKAIPAVRNDSKLSPPYTMTIVDK